MAALLLEVQRTGGSTEDPGYRLVILAESRALDVIAFKQWSVPKGLPLAEYSGRSGDLILDLRQLLKSSVFYETSSLGNTTLYFVTLDEFSLPLPIVANDSPRRVL